MLIRDRILVLALAVMIALLPGGALAQSYYYQVTGATGGTRSPGGSYAWQNGVGSTYGGKATSSTGTASCSGDVTFTFTWTGPQGSPLPASVIVAKTSTATWGGASGSCADGLNDQPNGDVSTGTHYEVKTNPGSTFMVTVSGAQSSGTAGIVGGKGIVGTASVWISMAATNVTVGIAGADSHLPYSTTTPGFLVGQPQVATISAGSFGLSNFSWTINGTDVFAQSAFTTDPNKPSNTYYSHQWVAIAAPFAGSCTYSAGFPGAISANCSATFNSPADGPLTVTGSASETAAAPTESLVLTAGTSWLQLGTPPPAQYQTATLWSGQNGGHGMTFSYYVQPPTPFYADEGGGTCFLTQLVENSEYLTTFYYPTPQYQKNDTAYYLDQSYLYPGSQAPGQDPGNPTPTKTLDYDSPSIKGNANYPDYLLSISVSNNYKMFLMYTAPPWSSNAPFGSPFDVPVQEYNWSWACSTSWSNGYWSAPSGNPTPGVSLSPGYGDFQWNATEYNG